MFNFVEELPAAKPSHVLKLGVIAALLVLSTIAGYILLNPAPPTPTGEVLGVTLYEAQPPTLAAQNPAAENPGAGAVLASTAPPSHAARTLLVLTPVKIHNPTGQPFSIFDLTGVVRLGNAEYQSATVSAADFPKVFSYYPDLVSYQQPPLLRHSVVQSGGDLQGLLVFSYPLTKEQWDRRASFQVRASFDHGRDIQLSGTNGDTDSQLSADAR